MPPSIDPISNLFGTGSSIFRRLFIFWGAGWIGDFLSSLTEMLRYLPGPNFFRNLAEAFLFSLPMWPWKIVDYMVDAPLYALVLIATIAFLFYKIVLSDGPNLFWFVLMITILTPGSLIASWEWKQLIPLAFIFVGLGAALWYAINLDYPEWGDRIRGWTGM